MVMDAFEQRQRQSVEDLEQIYYVTAAIVAALENNTFRVDNLGLEEVADRSDELGALARAIQQMVDIIQKQDQEISTLKQQLTEED
jgi:Amt family ammonium transporter